MGTQFRCLVCIVVFVYLQIHAPCVVAAGSESIDEQTKESVCTDSSGQTYPLGETMKDCITYKCAQIKGKNILQRKKQDCMDDNGQCVKLWNTTMSDCHTLRCWRLGWKYFLRSEKAACSVNGKCKPIKSTWSNNCFTYTCASIKGTFEQGYRAHATAVKDGCMWKGVCKSLNETWKDGCETKLCTKVARTVTRIDTVDFGCHYPTRGTKDSCLTENSIWKDPSTCIEYKCTPYTVNTHDGDSYREARAFPISYGCKWKVVCKSLNETWKDGCDTKLCTKVARTVTRIGTVDFGCENAGVCQPIGFKKSKLKCDEYECKYDKKLGSSTFVKTSGACLSASGECYAEGKTWTGKVRGKCQQMVCSRHTSTNTYFALKSSSMCTDPNGKCLEPRAKPTYSKTVVYGKKNFCACVQKNDDVNYKCIW